MARGAVWRATRGVRIKEEIRRADRPGRQTQNGAGKRRILWFDDDLDNEPLLRRLVVESRDEIVVATAFSEALSQAHGRRFDLYLIHRWRGDGVGLELCRRYARERR